MYTCIQYVVAPWKGTGTVNGYVQVYVIYVLKINWCTHSIPCTGWSAVYRSRLYVAYNYVTLKC